MPVAEISSRSLQFVSDSQFCKIRLSYHQNYKIVDAKIGDKLKLNDKFFSSVLDSFPDTKIIDKDALNSRIVTIQKFSSYSAYNSEFSYYVFLNEIELPNSLGYSMGYNTECWFEFDEELLNQNSKNLIPTTQKTAYTCGRCGKEIEQVFWEHSGTYEWIHTGTQVYCCNNKIPNEFAFLDIAHTKLPVHESSNEVVKVVGKPYIETIKIQDYVKTYGRKFRKN